MSARSRCGFLGTLLTREPIISTGVFLSIPSFGCKLASIRGVVRLEGPSHLESPAQLELLKWAWARALSSASDRWESSKIWAATATVCSTGSYPSDPNLATHARPICTAIDCALWGNALSPKAKPGGVCASLSGVSPAPCRRSENRLGESRARSPRPEPQAASSPARPPPARRGDGSEMG